MISFPVQKNYVSKIEVATQEGFDLFVGIVVTWTSGIDPRLIEELHVKAL